MKKSVVNTTLFRTFCRLVIAIVLVSHTNPVVAQTNGEKRAKFLPHSDPEDLGKWEPQSSFSDEFEDGTVSNVWHLQGTADSDRPYYNSFKGRNSQYTPTAISESNGLLKIKSDWNTDFKFAKGHGSPPITTGALVSKQFLKYGYMEIRCRVGKSPMSAAFWAVGNDNGGELDVFEHVGKSWDLQKSNSDITTTMQMSIHNWNPKINESLCNRRHWTQKHSLGFDITDGMHVYAADWTESYVKFYVDGTLVRTLTKAEADNAKINGLGGWVLDHQMRIWIDCELFEWEGRISELKSDMFGSEAVFEVDYVRVWKRGDGGKHQTTGHGSNLIANGSFATDLAGWNSEGAVVTQDVSKWKFWKDNNPSKDPNVMQIGAGGKGLASQTISVEPKTKYLLTAHLRMPATTGTLEPSNLRAKPVVFHEGWMGVEEYGGIRLTRKLFHNWFQSYSIEFTSGEDNTKATIFFNNTESPRGGLFHVDSVSVVKLSNLMPGSK